VVQYRDNDFFGTAANRAARTMAAAHGGQVIVFAGRPRPGGGPTPAPVRPRERYYASTSNPDNIWAHEQ